MNKLSKELQKHGFAESSIDGAEKAQIFMKNKSGEPSVLTESENAIQEHLIKILHSMESLKTFRNVSEQRIIQLEDNFKLVLDKMNEVIAEINDIKSRPVAAAVPGEKETQTRLPEKKAESAHGKESHPRQGNYTPADVAIDKIFYYGQK